MRGRDARSLRVAICDDTDSDRAALERAASVVSCADTPTLLAAHAVEPFDILLLDVVLSGSNGIELARQLQSAGSHAVVVFVSSSPEFAADSFGAGVSYLIKPYTDVQFGAAFDRALAALAQQRDESIVFKCPEGVRRIAASDIRRAETRGHHQEIFLAAGGQFLVRLSHADLFARVEPFGSFVEAGLSSVLNLDHVLEVANGRAVLDDGTEVIIPRRLFARIHDAFFRHYCS